VKTVAQLFVGIALGAVSIGILVWLIARRGRSRWNRADTLALLSFLATAAIGVVQIVQGAQESPAATERAAAPSQPAIDYVDELPPVKGRAAKPTDVITGHGLQVPKPGMFFSFSDFNGVSRKITYEDWNTIVATSSVPVVVPVRIDPSWGPTKTDLRRSQYLANLVGEPPSGTVDARTIISWRLAEDQVATAILLVNARDAPVNITGLNLTMRTPGGKTVLEGSFFGEGSHSVRVSPHSAYLTHLRWTGRQAERWEAPDSVNADLRLRWTQT
jgi:hypothetical protein